MAADSKRLSRSWQEWLDENGDRLLMYARQSTHSVAEAEDLLQDAIVRLWKYQADKNYVPPDLPLAFHTLRFCMLDFGRRKTRTKKRDEKIIDLNRDLDVWHDPTLEEDEEARILRKAVHELSPKLREVMTLKIWGGLTFAAIAETLDISNNTAASRYRYALEALQEKLKPLKANRHA